MNPHGSRHIEDKWPFYPKNISEIFRGDEIALVRIVLSSLNEELSVPCVMVELPGNDFNFYYPEVQNQKYPPFCTYMESLKGGRQACQQSTEENVRKYRSSGLTEPLELTCHLGLTNVICSFDVLGETLAFCSICKMKRINSEQYILDNKKKLRGRLTTERSFNTDKLEKYIVSGKQIVNVWSEPEISEFKRNFKQKLSFISKLVEHQYLTEKELKEREFINYVENTISLSLQKKGNELSELNNTTISEIKEFLGTKYIAVFSSNEYDETVLPLVIHSGLVEKEISGTIHFNWRKSGLPLYSSDIMMKSSISLNAQRIYTQGVEGLNRGLLSDMTYCFPNIFTARCRGLVVLGPFEKAFDEHREQDFLNRLCRVINFSVTSLRIMQSFTFLDRQRRLMISLTAHRINSNLHMILGETSELNYLIKSPEKTLKYQQRLALCLKKIEKGVENLRLNAELTMKSPDTAIIDGFGQIDIPKRPYSISVLVENCVERVRESARKHGNEIELDSSVERLLPVKMEVWLMEQVFLNLLDNAVKYSIPGKSIKIAGRTDPAFSRESITIQNYGKGITTGDIPLLFGMGFRGNNFYRGKEVKGAGLGLYIVKKILDVHKSEIAVHSCHISGSRVDEQNWNNITEFTVTIPTMFSVYKEE
jgi:signal transduction histidine kinase